MIQEIRQFQQVLLNLRFSGFCPFYFDSHIETALVFGAEIQSLPITVRQSLFPNTGDFACDLKPLPTKCSKHSFIKNVFTKYSVDLTGREIADVTDECSFHAIKCFNGCTIGHSFIIPNKICSKPKRKFWILQLVCKGNGNQ